MSEIKVTRVDGIDPRKDDIVVEAVRVPSHDSEKQRNTSTSNSSTSNIGRLWLWELSSWIACAAALLGLVGFLAAMDNKFTTDWTISGSYHGSTKTFHVTVNSIVSIFSTLVKSAVMIPVASCISSLMFLWTMRGRQLACLRALITVGSLAMDFSFQQLVNYPLTPTSTATAYMPATPIYSSFTEDIRPDLSIVTAVQIGMQNLSATIPVIPDCSAGTCLWGKNITTLAICSECHDTTPLIQSDCTTVDYTTESFEFCDYYYSDHNIALSTKPDEYGDYRVTQFQSVRISEDQSLTFGNRTKKIASLRTLGLIDETGTMTKPYGAECILYCCANKYETSVTNNTLSEKLIDVFRGNAIVGPSPEDIIIANGLYLVPDKSFLEDTDSANLVNSSAFVITGYASESLQRGPLFDIFKNQVDFINNTLAAIMSTGYPPPANESANYIPPIETGPIVRDMRGMKFEVLDERMRNVAGNMTNAVRMSNHALAGRNNTNAAGDVMQFVPVVVVVWGWIAIPALLTSLSLLLLLLTIWTGSRNGTILWKGSALAAFYHPLARDGRLKIGTALGYKELDKLADNLTVKVERTDKGHRLVRSW